MRRKLARGDQIEYRCRESRKQAKTGTDRAFMFAAKMDQRDVFSAGVKGALRTVRSNLRQARQGTRGGAWVSA